MEIEYIIVFTTIIAVVFFRLKHLKTKKIKDTKRREDKIIYDKNKSLLKEKKTKEDFELSLQKEVRCDDGVVRIYKQNMYGSLREKNESIGVEKVIVAIKDINQMSKNSGYDYIKDLFNKNIKNESWFSESGVTLNLEQILIKEDYRVNMSNSYKNRYKSLLSNLIIKFSKSVKEKEDLIIINNYVFLETPFTPFYGEIDGINYIHGEKEINELKEDSHLEDKSETLSLKKILEMNSSREHKITFSFTEEWKHCYFQDKNKSNENLENNTLPVLDDKYDQDTGEPLYNENDEKVFDPKQEIKYEYYLPITQSKVLSSKSFIGLLQNKINELIKLNEISIESDIYELIEAMNIYQNPEAIEELFNDINCKDWIDLKTGKNGYDSVLWITSSQLDETNINFLIEEV